MNQREALATLVIDVREHEPEEKQLLRALKWADKRLQTLQDREERRKVPIDPDLRDEQLTIDSDLVISDLKGTTCRACWGKKRTRSSFCPGCYIKLPAGTRKALWRMDDLYYYAYNRSVRLLDEMRAAA